MEGFKHIIRYSLSLSGTGRVASSLWCSGAMVSVTEESDGVLDLVDSCLEVRGYLVIAEQFFRDDAVLQLRHQFCGDSL